MEENYKTNNGGIKQPSYLWIGLIFIVGGAIVLLNQIGVLSFELNWWALFILLPAFGTLSGAYNLYRATNDLFSTGMTFPASLGLFMVPYRPVCWSDHHETSTGACTGPSPLFLSARV